ncbi:hypothetical protein V8C37DRAFT_399377 [Trichoderma ceciliae]
MSTDNVDIPDVGSEIQGSSQIETADQAAERSQLRHYKKRFYSDSEDHSSTDEASDESMGFTEDIKSKKPRVTTNETPRTLRSQSVKEAPMDSERLTPNRRVILKTGKQSHDIHEIEPMKPGKRGRKPSANTEIKSFKKDSLGLAERYASKVRDAETFISDNEELQLQVDILKTQLEELASALDEITQGSGKYVKVPDSDIVEKWMQLSYNIRCLVAQCLTEQPTNQSDIVKDLMMKVEVSLPPFSYGITSLRINVLRRAIWHLIIFGVFSGKLPIWHGEAGQTLTHLLAEKNRDHLEDPHYLKIISQMKFRAIVDLGEETRLNEEAMNHLTEKAVLYLGAFILDSRMEEFQAEMKQLIAKAAHLHTIMMRSKAIFSLQWIGDDYGKGLPPYNPTTMVSLQEEVDTGASHSAVEFVEAPALVKIGNADGGKFDLSMILCKSSVILEEKKVALRPEGQDAVRGDTP